MLTRLCIVDYETLQLQQAGTDENLDETTLTGDEETQDTTGTNVHNTPLSSPQCFSGATTPNTTSPKLIEPLQQRFPSLPPMVSPVVIPYSVTWNLPPQTMRTPHLTDSRRDSLRASPIPSISNWAHLTKEVGCNNIQHNTAQHNTTQYTPPHTHTHTTQQQHRFRCQHSRVIWISRTFHCHQSRRVVQPRKQHVLRMLVIARPFPTPLMINEAYPPFFIKKTKTKGSRQRSQPRRSPSTSVLHDCDMKKEANEGRLAHFWLYCYFCKVRNLALFFLSYWRRKIAGKNANSFPSCPDKINQTQRG